MKKSETTGAYPVVSSLDQKSFDHVGLRIPSVLNWMGKHHFPGRSLFLTGIDPDHCGVNLCGGPDFQLSLTQFRYTIPRPYRFLANYRGYRGAICQRGDIPGRVHENETDSFIIIVHRKDAASDGHTIEPGNTTENRWEEKKSTFSGIGFSLFQSLHCTKTAKTLN